MLEAPILPSPLLLLLLLLLQLLLLAEVDDELVGLCIEGDGVQEDGRIELSGLITPPLAIEVDDAGVLLELGILL